MTEMNDKPRVLLLAYYFPPDSSSGALRPLFFANHLQNMGIHVTVLTAVEDDFLSEQPKDPGLCSRVHKDVEIVRAKVKRPREFVLAFRDKFKTGKKGNYKSAEVKQTGLSELSGHQTNEPKSIGQNVKDLITDLLASPDPHVGWILDAVKQGSELIKKKNISVIMATGSPWSCLIAGVLLARKSKLPLVLDFRDPWVANPGFVQRGKVAAFLEKYMERYVVTKTNTIVANTKELRYNFLQRFPFLHPENVHTLSNGFEQFLGSDMPDNSSFTLVHAGALYFSRTPLPLLQALYELVREGKISETRISVVLVGGIGVTDRKLKELLQTKELQKTVKLIPRLPYKEAMEYQLHADVLLLIQPGFPLQVPRKLYEYMAMRRPVLALTEAESATARIVQDCRMGKVVDNIAAKIKPVLLEMYTSWSDNQVNNMSIEPVARYRNSTLTQKLYTILEKTISDNT